MLTEYAQAVSHESYLSAEERRRMSERNRGAASHCIPLQEETPPAPKPALRKAAAKRRRSRAAAEEAAPATDEREAMRLRMEQSERNRRRANGEIPEYTEAAQQPEPQEAEAAPRPAHRPISPEKDRYDTGLCHAASVARSSLRRMEEPIRGFYFCFPFISGSSALRPEAVTHAEPQQAPAELRASSAEPDASEGGSSRKVFGTRYGENSHGGGYQRRITTGSAVLIGILTVLLIGCVIYGKVQTNEIYTKIAELQAEYDDINARNVSMKSEMEGKLTVKNIEDYAENVLGLRPLDQSQIQYIQIQTEDEVVITEPEENIIVTINDYITSFWEFLRGA